MLARYRFMTSSVHIYLTVVTGFLIVIFYRNQVQRSSSKEEEVLRAFVYVDILPVVDWDNTR